MGEHIRVSLYDNRLEIFSPGALPNIVTLENMLNTRYSRNPRIARVLSEFGWVKELNEGVKRIYDEMQSYYLAAPLYEQPNNNSVQLTLENSITSRTLRLNNTFSNRIGSGIKQELNEYGIKIIQYLMVQGSISVKRTKELIGKGETVSRRQLKILEEKSLIEWHGSNKSDPTQYYILKL